MKKSEADISTLKGIGPKSKLQYEKLGIYKVIDLINYFPRAYEDNSGFTPVAELELGKNSIIEVSVLSKARLIYVKRLSILEVKVGDESGEITLLFYNQPYLKSTLTVGKKLIIKGKLTIKNSKNAMISPHFISEKDYAFIADKPLIPVYRLTQKLSNKKLREKLEEAFDYIDEDIAEPLPKEILNKYDLIGIREALKIIHFPDSYEELAKARKRLIFDEFLRFTLALNILKKENISVENDFKIKKSAQNDELINSFPFELSASQKSVIKEIESDIFSKYSMNRLIQGDVGSGKTLIATMAVLNVSKSGYQSVIMAPTEVLANQHFESFSTALSRFGLRIEVLTSSVKKVDKIRIKTELKSGEIDVLIATHAVLTDDTEFKNLALVVTDEQHRFGVSQREKLVNKGNRPHTLVMSATPIPRTLALILYSDMDLSINDDMPKGRIPINTYFVNTSYRERIYNFLQKEVDKGNQAYIVCAKADFDEESPLIDVMTYKDMIRNFVPENYRIEALHGKMKNDDKNRIMQDFVDKKIDILVSTTVIEVGINVKDATCIVIENAERFGLSQLHQLRGRVGRSDKESYCVLISDSDNEDTKARLDIMCDTNNGFEIARKDLALRGHGDLLGVKQSGIPEFRLGNIYDDYELLEITKNLANYLISSDEFQKMEYNLLREEIFKYLESLEGFTL